MTLPEEYYNKPPAQKQRHTNINLEAPATLLFQNFANMRSDKTKALFSVSLTVSTKISEQWHL